MKTLVKSDLANKAKLNVTRVSPAESKDSFKI
jgi:hypothetical protein